MIISARRLHKSVWLLLALVLPILFAAGIYLRHSEPLNEEIPTVERIAPPASEKQTSPVN